jgi:2-haloacid dehalogenase
MLTTTSSPGRTRGWGRRWLDHRPAGWRRKPAPAHFEVALDRIGLPKEQVVHVAQSLFHDHIPARALGLRSVWVDRRGGKAGPGATPPAAAEPDLIVPDLATLARLAAES